MPAMACHPALAHRGGLATRVTRMRPSPTVLRRIGGRPAVRRIVEALYAGIEDDPTIRPLFRSDLRAEVDAQTDFFEGWLGGETRWSTYRGLDEKHAGLPITRAGARAWAGHFAAGLEAAGVAAAERKEVLAVIRPLAMALVNDHEQPRVPLNCGHVYKDAAATAARGDRDGVRRILRDRPEFSRPAGTGIQLLLAHAARRGHTELVGDLLDAGADVDLPDGSRTILRVSAYAQARAAKKHETAAELLSRGATVDVFSAAFAGEADLLAELLDEDPRLVNVVDPAMAFRDSRPLEHALAAAQVESARVLLERGADVEGAARLDQALGAGRRAPELVGLLLDHGADANRLEPGEWVLEPDLADAIFSRGVHFDDVSDAWIEYCTGHHGNRENPELIQAFVDHGVDVDQRTEKGRTGLHCATRMGYLDVMRVLIEAGADVEARDRNGDTPLAYVLDARRSADVEACARLLIEAGASPEARDERGRTVRERARAARRPESRALAAWI